MPDTLTQRLAALADATEEALGLSPDNVAASELDAAIDDEAAAIRAALGREHFDNAWEHSILFDIELGDLERARAKLKGDWEPPDVRD